MAISMTLKQYLDRRGIQYDVLPHPHSESSMATAQAAGISGEKIAKSVLLEDDDGYLMAVLPATHHIHFGQLHHLLNRRLGMATEPEMVTLFTDCEMGAIPAIGQAYGVDVVMDDCLCDRSEIYFESGDHEDLIHMGGDEFEQLMLGAHHGEFSRHI